MDFHAPAPVMTNPQGIDLPLKALQQQLAGVSYIEKSYARAVSRYQATEAGTMRYIPAVYAERGQYIPMLPNDQVKAFSFWVTHDPTVPVPNSDALKQDVSLIVYGNLSNIRPLSDETFEQELLNELLLSLEGAPVRWTLQGIYTGTRNVYEGYSLAGFEDRFMAHPFFGFRIRMSLLYYKPC